MGKTLKILITLSLYSILSVSTGQTIDDHHSNLKKLLASEKKEKVRLLKEVDFSLDWVDKLEDSLFVNFTFRNSCKNERVDDFVKQLDKKKARELIKNTPVFTWKKHQLNSRFKLRNKLSKKGLTYQYSIPIIDNNKGALRIKSFDSYNTMLGDYIYLMERDANHNWQTICVLVIQETYPHYKL